MEWGVKEHHVAVIALHNCGKSQSQIFELLKPMNECIKLMNKGKVMTVQFPSPPLFTTVLGARQSTENNGLGS
jgi:hypothetical protein